MAGWQIAAPYEVREGVGRDGGAALVFDAETPPPYSVPNQGFSVKPGRSYLAGSAPVRNWARMRTAWIAPGEAAEFEADLPEPHSDFNERR